MALFDEPARHDPGGKVKSALPAGLRGDAIFSPCERYRPLLRRWTGDVFPDRFILFIGMNPSTASAEHNDPTITREWGFAAREGFSGYAKCNVADFRATDPAGLEQADVVPVSPINRATILEMATRASVVVMAHGRLGRSIRQEGVDVVEMLRRNGVVLHCLGTNADGSPKHPLYLRQTTPLETF